MPSTPRPTRAAAAKCSAKLDHHAAKTKNRRVRRHERRIIGKSTRAKQVQKQLVAEAPPTMVPVAGFVADCVWSKLNGASNMMEMLTALCKEGAEDQVETNFYFQHPDASVAQGMVALVDDTADEDEDGECAFPEVFTPALEDIDKASEFTLSGTTGLLTCIPMAIPETREVNVNVKLGGMEVGVLGPMYCGGKASVVFPYDPSRYGELYAAAGDSGQLTKSVNKA